MLKHFELIFLGQMEHVGAEATSEYDARKEVLEVALAKIGLF